MNISIISVLITVSGLIVRQQVYAHLHSTVPVGHDFLFCWSFQKSCVLFNLLSYTFISEHCIIVYIHVYLPSYISFNVFLMDEEAFVCIPLLFD